jgi:uncharacterized protein YdeI (YjbR/CyaY-like superfamily)
MKTLPRLEVASAQEWRRWLALHHASSHGVWLVFHKPASAGRGPAYRAALEEALCFGWIDSIIKREGAETYLRKFTPRTNAKLWSETNKRLAQELIRSRRMTLVGRKVIGVPLGRRTAPAVTRGASAELPAVLREALAKRPKAAAFFEQLAPGYRQRYLFWILSAKQDETRARRVAEAVRLLEQGVKSLLK